MLLKQVNTELLLEEIQTDGHAPLKFLCNNGQIYYCKHLPTMNRSEINCLAYEVVANYLLQQLDIPTPEIALVEVSEGTLNKTMITANRRLRVGEICFGSEEVKYAQELHALQEIKTKTEYNKILNPTDIVKIALFDLWVNNMDRGRYFDEVGINYNLLIKPVGTKQQILAFDNAFIFGGIDQIGIFNTSFGVNSTNKLVSTPYYKSLIKYIDQNYFLEIVNNFIHLLPDNYEESISNIVKVLSKNWELTPNLDKRIIAFLSSEEHIANCKHIIIQSKK